jgi:hypothetical protein
MRAILSKMEAYAYFMVLDIKGIVNFWNKLIDSSCKGLGLRLQFFESLGY